MNIENLIKEYVKNGYTFLDARSKVGQDIILFKIFNSDFKKHITVKGGVVIHNISKNLRRATRDIDLDFIKYSLEDSSIRNFISKLNDLNDGISVEIIGDIDSLHHQDYDGKRVLVNLIDKNGFKIELKMDIGVHKLFDIKQDEYCFDLNLMGKNINLLINSKEQIFAEKLKSLLKLGARSTRYKDLYDFYYLIHEENFNKTKLLNYIDILILSDKTVKENTMEEVLERLIRILKSKIYLANLKTPRVNWLNLNHDDVIKNVINYIQNLVEIKQ